MEASTVGLRVFREVAERGSFTAAAVSLGYTQSAVSRQIAALEGAAGARLFERRRSGVVLTVAGRTLLPRASAALVELEAATRELAGGRMRVRVRLGGFPSSGPVLVAGALAAVRARHPAVELVTREAPTPALVRALRAGTLEVAVLAWTPPFRGFDAVRPELHVEVLREDDLMLAVPAGHPFAEAGVVPVERLRGQRWVGSRPSADATLLGVWPGLAERPAVSHVAQDWLTKLALVAAGAGITSLPAFLRAVLPDGVRMVGVSGGSDERRRVVLARLPGQPRPGVPEVAAALRDLT